MQDPDVGEMQSMSGGQQKARQIYGPWTTLPGAVWGVLAPRSTYSRGSTTTRVVVYCLLPQGASKAGTLLYSVSGSTLTWSHKQGGLKQQSCMLSQFRRAEG